MFLRIQTSKIIWMNENLINVSMHLVCSFIVGWKGSWPCFLSLLKARVLSLDQTKCLVYGEYPRL